MPAAAALICLVIAIADGDTLTARCEAANGMENIKVRLAEIDAPEKGQAFGARSKQHLAELCFQKQATVTPRAKDRYLRTVANVECEGVDAAMEQVPLGCDLTARPAAARQGPTKESAGMGSCPRWRPATCS